MVEPGRHGGVRVASPEADPEVRAAVAVVAGLLRRTRDTIADAIAGELISSIDGLADPQLVELLATSIDGNISTLIDAWEHDIAVERVQPPTAAREYAVRLAQRGIPAVALARAYHIGQNHMLEFCFAAVAESDIDDRLRFGAIRRIAEVMTGYLEWITRQLLEDYEKEQRLWLSTRSTMHASMVHTMLSDGPRVAADFERETGYLLDQRHLGAVLHCEGEDAATVNRVLRAVAAAAKAVGSPLITAVDRHTTWAWIPLGRQVQRAPVDVAAVRSAVAGTRCTIALGVPVEGEEGFRRTHEQAVQAYRLQRSTAAGLRPVMSFTDDAVAVLARLAEDPVGTRIWVVEALGALARNRDSEKRLRETLLTFIRTGGSYAQSAALLNVHANTVKYRVRKALEVRQRPIGDDRLTLELALQACEYLGDKVLLED